MNRADTRSIPTLLGSFLLTTSPVVSLAQAPWDAHGALTISPSGRQFQHADGTPFFWLGDTTWEIATRMKFNAEAPDRRGIEWYLDDRAAKGFNVIQAPVITPLTGPGGTNVAGQKVNTAPSFDPDNLNDLYLQRYDRIVDEAAARGIYVAILPTWGSNVNSGYIDAAKAERFGQVLGARYADRRNVIWMLGGDTSPMPQSGPQAGQDFRPVWNAMAKGIANGVNGTLGAAAPDFGTTLMTFHPPGAQTSSAYNFASTSGGNWMDFNSIQSSHDDPTNDNPGTPSFNPHFDRLSTDYAINPPRPVINAEPAYEDIRMGLSSSTTAPRHGAYEVRLAAWWGVIGGGAGHTYGHNDIWQAYGPGYSPQFGADSNWQDAVAAPGAAQMTYLKNLVLSRPYAERVRDDSLIANFSALRTNKTASTSFASRGDDYAVFYSGNGSTLDVAMGKIAGSTVQGWWYNPRTGAATMLGTFANTGTQSFNPPGAPGDDNDWVLVLSDTRAGHGAPGQVIDQTAFRKLDEDFAYLHRFDSRATAGNGKITSANGAVTFNVGTTSGSHRAVVASHRRDFDFSDQPLCIDLTGLILSGDPGSSANALYVAIGQGTATGEPYGIWPSGEMANGLSFEIQKRSGGYRLGFVEVANGVARQSYFDLSAMPTDLRVLLSGKDQSWQAIVDGAAFSATGKSLHAGSWSFLDPGDASQYRLALGAYNAGAVTDATVASVDALSVTLVPEPSALALIGLAGLALSRRRRRRCNEPRKGQFA